MSSKDPSRVLCLHGLMPSVMSSVFVEIDMINASGVVGRYSISELEGMRVVRGTTQGGRARELNQDRTDAAGGSRDQQRTRIDALARHGTEPIEKQLPAGDRSQRQGGCLGKRQRLWLVADDALIN
jgi:hypothetical protein